MIREQILNISVTKHDAVTKVRALLSACPLMILFFSC